MKLVIGDHEVDARPVSEGSFLSANTGATLRQLTVTFTIEGKDAGERYNSLEQEASTKGLVSPDTDPANEIRWELYDFTGSGFEREGDDSVCTALWTLREREDTRTE